MLSALLLILLSAALTTTMALMSAPQWRPFSGVTDVYATARQFAAASAAVMPTVGLANWLLGRYVLAPFELEYLRTLVFTVVLLVVVFAAEAALRRRTRLRPERPGFILLLSANGAALGVALLADASTRSFAGAAFASLGGTAAFAVLLLALAAMLDRLRGADAPAVFREAPLALISAGLMALGFMGFTGLIQE